MRYTPRVSGASFSGVFMCLCMAFDAKPEFFTWSWWPELQRLAHNDFSSYCTGRHWAQRHFLLLPRRELARPTLGEPLRLSGVAHLKPAGCFDAGRPGRHRALRAAERRLSTAGRREQAAVWLELSSKLCPPLLVRPALMASPDLLRSICGLGVLRLLDAAALAVTSWPESTCKMGLANWPPARRRAAAHMVHPSLHLSAQTCQPPLNRLPSGWRNLYDLWLLGSTGAMG